MTRNKKIPGAEHAAQCGCKNCRNKETREYLADRKKWIVKHPSEIIPGCNCDQFEYGHCAHTYEKELFEQDRNSRYKPR